MKKLTIAFLCGLCLSLAVAPFVRSAAPDPRVETPRVDRHPPLDPSGAMNVLVEIPAGSDAKWEVDKRDGQLRWQLEDGRPRVVGYLPYPGNYGMVPGTLLPRELGGDGDPLDVIVLGPAVARGSLVPARPIGVLKLLDGGDQDDKLLAVQAGTPLGSVRELSELEQHFPGVKEIVEIWFSRYKGPGRMESAGFGDRAEAERILRTAIRAHAAHGAHAAR